MLAVLLAGAAVVVLLLRQRNLQPQDVIGTPLSDEWLRHTRYQLTKPGGAVEAYGERD